VEPAPGQTPPPTNAEEGVVYVRPLAVRAARQVWIFVLGSDGRLRRAR
jgi:hypothetical protein